MIPQTYPTIEDSEGRKMVISRLSSVTGLQPWVDYIPIKAGTAPLNSYNGAIGMTEISSLVGKQAWLDYIPVYEDNALTREFSTDVGGYIPYIGGSGTATQTTIASPHNYFWNARETTVTGFLTRRFRMPIYISGDRKNLRFAFSGNYIAGALGNNYTIVSLALEQNSPSAFTPITFSGSRSVVVTNGTVELLSDAVLPSAFSLSQFSGGSLYWLRGEYSVASAGMFMPMGRSYVSSTGLTSPQCIGVAMQASSVVSAVDATGNMTFSGVNDYRNPYLPIVVGDLVTPSSAQSIFGVGNSIMFGQGGNQENGLTSLYQKAAMDVGLTSGVTGGLWFGVAGTTYTQILGKPWITYYAKYATKVLDEYGTNYFASGSTADPTAAKADAQAFWAQVAAAGCTKIIRTKLLPRTITTDGTVVFNSSYGAGGSARQFNDWMDTPSLGAAQGVTLQIEQQNSLRLGTNQASDDFYKWAGASSGVLGANTTDGTHLTTAGNTLGAPDIRADYIS